MNFLVKLSDVCYNQEASKSEVQKVRYAMSNYVPVPIVDRTSMIIDIILKSPEGISASDLLNQTDIPKTTLYRLLTSLVDNDFLSYNSKAGLFGIGQKFTMTYTFMQEQNSRLCEASLEYLNKLSEQLQETTKLSVLSGWEACVIATVESPQPIRIKIELGASFPLHAGATGKILLCEFDNSSIRKYFSNYAQPYTSNTIISADKMISELESIRKRGFALDNGEYSSEISAIAVPIKNPSGSTIAALSVPYPSIHRDRVNTIQSIDLLKQTATDIAHSFAKVAHKQNSAVLISANNPDFTK